MNKYIRDMQNGYFSFTSFLKFKFCFELEELCTCEFSERLY